MSFLGLLGSQRLVTFVAHNFHFAVDQAVPELPKGLAYISKSRDSVRVVDFIDRTLLLTQSTRLQRPALLLRHSHDATAA